MGGAERDLLTSTTVKELCLWAGSGAGIVQQLGILGKTVLVFAPILSETRARWIPAAGKATRDGWAETHTPRGLPASVRLLLDVCSWSHVTPPGPAGSCDQKKR